MPEPSRLVLLEQLPTVSSGTKIRLLGCVHAHAPSEAKIILKDKYPATTSEFPNAIVDIVNVLENVNHEVLQVGSWINIMGYVRKPVAGAKRTQNGSRDLDGASTSTYVEATMIWSAGAIKLDRYQNATRDYQKLR